MLPSANYCGRGPRFLWLPSRQGGFFERELYLVWGWHPVRVAYGRPGRFRIPHGFLPSLSISRQRSLLRSRSILFNRRDPVTRLLCAFLLLCQSSCLCLCLPRACVLPILRRVSPRPWTSRRIPISYKLLRSSRLPCRVPHRGTTRLLSRLRSRICLGGLPTSFRIPSVSLEFPRFPCERLLCASSLLRAFPNGTSIPRRGTRIPSPPRPWIHNKSTCLPLLHYGV